MSERSTSTSLAILFFFVLISMTSNSYAHRVNVFAYLEGDKIYTESYFSKKKRVHQGKVEVFNTADGNLLLTGKTDDDGNFNFPLPEETKKSRSGLLIALYASEGHRGEWTIPADELFPDMAQGEEAELSTTTNISAETGDQIPSTEIAPLYTELKELNAKVETLKRLMIDQQKNGPGANEIFSGIGYILGLFGVAAFFISRKK
ncbi:hypothetical protein [Maridesulfovibrio hydrothermalis]|uniref:Nickel transport protein n=1 Tax=Maridesulfovibrio hydrothermalis AM13 = DSM 14728 TaxID=1121451 RepID=L0RGF5_9BACT|nr:hypothetical protein [Maridesulfovibrio hydrothermalis]CCO24651.1 conserved exported protein of unknown function [Maridesulfovibrio hydrothermalis AM13 = DSM 14728]